MAYQAGLNAGVECYKVWTDTAAISKADLGATWFSTDLDEALTRWSGNTGVHTSKTLDTQVREGGTLCQCKDPANEGKLFLLDAVGKHKIVENPLKA